VCRWCLFSRDVEHTTIDGRKEIPVSFNNVGSLTFLAPGQQTVWNYSYASDQGFQHAGADVKTPNSGAHHLADLQAKEKDNNGATAYFVRITNQGPGGAWHNLQGGGAA
jgi:hypothetical protein